MKVNTTKFAHTCGKKLHVFSTDFSFRVLLSFSEIRVNGVFSLSGHGACSLVCVPCWDFGPPGEHGEFIYALVLGMWP